MCYGLTQDDGRRTDIYISACTTHAQQRSTLNAQRSTLNAQRSTSSKRQLFLSAVIIGECGVSWFEKDLADFADADIL
jgi:hypothetical protein